MSASPLNVTTTREATCIHEFKERHIPIIMANLCSNAAGAGCFVAFCVLKISSIRCGFGYKSRRLEARADAARLACARWGGLNDESRMKSVLGSEDAAWSISA